MFGCATGPNKFDCVVWPNDPVDAGCEEAVVEAWGCDAGAAKENAGGAALGVELPSLDGSAGLPKREGVDEAGFLQIGGSVPDSGASGQPHSRCRGCCRCSEKA